MKHDFARVIGFKQMGDYVLQVVFNDGTSRSIDFLPVLTGELFEPLRDKDFFAQVRVDPEAGTLVWPNGADFDPDLLHDWARWKDAFHAQVSALATHH